MQVPRAVSRGRTAKGRPLTEKARHLQAIEDRVTVPIDEVREHVIAIVAGGQEPMEVVRRIASLVKNLAAFFGQLNRDAYAFLRSLRDAGKLAAEALVALERASSVRKAAAKKTAKRPKAKKKTSAKR